MDREWQVASPKVVGGEEIGLGFWVLGLGTFIFSQTIQIPKTKDPRRKTQDEKPLITHPEKVLFPGDGITKAELASYYEAIAPLMLPHIRNRHNNGAIPPRYR
jgi:hypothetical protein